MTAAGRGTRTSTRMTDRARRRASKRELRAWAWTAGGLAFLAPWAALGASPQPASARAAGERPVILIRKITRRVVVQHPSANQAPVRYVYANGGSASSVPNAGAVNAAPPMTNTGGS